jgi:predicted nucleic acid-binding protein
MLFIYQFEKYKKFWQKTKIVFSGLEEGKFRGVTSVIGLIEILTKPKQKKNYLLVKEYQELLTGFPNLTIASVDLKIADLSSSLRAKYNLATPDAILVATALSCGATGFITADMGLKKIEELEVFILR